MTNPFGTDLDPFLDDPATHGDVVLTAGSYWHVPAGSQHTTTCVGPEVCWFYFHAEEAFDFAPIVDMDGALLDGIELETPPDDAVLLPNAELEFAGEAGSFVQFAPAWGAMAEGAHGTFGSFEAGAASAGPRPLGRLLRCRRLGRADQPVRPRGRSSRPHPGRLLVRPRRVGPRHRLRRGLRVPVLLPRPQRVRLHPRVRPGLIGAVVVIHSARASDRADRAAAAPSAAAATARGDRAGRGGGGQRPDDPGLRFAVQQQRIDAKRLAAAAQGLRPSAVAGQADPVDADDADLLARLAAHEVEHAADNVLTMLDRVDAGDPEIDTRVERAARWLLRLNLELADMAQTPGGRGRRPPRPRAGPGARARRGVGRAADEGRRATPARRGGPAAVARGLEPQCRRLRTGPAWSHAATLRALPMRFSIVMPLFLLACGSRGGEPPRHRQRPDRRGRRRLHRRRGRRRSPAGHHRGG